ncbi:MAG: DUF2764 family protein [Rikenellaceae bacterium]|nr:DUF2764 family protein [Rikenellaceae bacterium]
MFSKEYYYLVAGLKEWTLESDAKGFDVAEIRDEILEAISDSDRQAVRELYAYYDCENIIAAHAGRDRYNPLGNLSKEEVEAVFSERCYSKLPKAVAEVVKRYNEADDDERDDEVALDDRFERAVFEAYYLGLEKSKCSFLKAWGEFDRNLRNIAAAVAAREANRSISDVVVGRGEVVEQLSRSSAADFGLRGELQYIDSVIAAVSDERNIVEKERKIDAIRWAEAEDIVVFDFFNINFILSYLVKVNIVARWNMLSPEVGRRMLERLMQELDSKELVNKQ